VILFLYFKIFICGGKVYFRKYSSLKDILKDIHFFYLFPQNFYIPSKSSIFALETLKKTTMAIRLNISGVKKVKEFVNQMGGVMPIADFGFTHKGRLIQCLAVETEGGELKLKFRHYFGENYYKNVHPSVQKVNDIVKMVITKFGL
jgi:hypothetical protein